MPFLDILSKLPGMSSWFFAIIVMSFAVGLAAQSTASLPILKKCWEYPASELNERGIAVDSSAAYFSEHGGRIEAVSIDNGRRLWFSDLGGEIISNMVANESAIFVATRSSTAGSEIQKTFLRSLSKSTGITNWEAEIKDTDVVFLGLSNSNLVAAAASGLVVAVQAASGTTSWTLGLNAKIDVDPSFLGGRMLVADDNREVIVISTESGDISAKIKLAYRPTALLLIENDRAAWGDERGNVVFLNSASKKTIWRIKHGGAISDMIDLGDTLLVTSNDNFAYSIALYNGGIRWKKRQPDRIFRPGLLATEFVVLSSRSGGNSTVLDKDNGKAINSISVNPNDALIQAPMTNNAANILFPTVVGIQAYALEGCPSN